MRIYGLIGNPLGHSFSRRYFSQKFKYEHIDDCEYYNFEIIDLEKEIQTQFYSALQLLQMRQDKD